MDVAGYYQLQGQNLDKPMIPKEVQVLSLEQEFELTRFRADVDRMSPDDCREALKQLMKIYAIKQNILRYFMGKELKVNQKVCNRGV